MTFELRALPIPSQTEKAYWFVFMNDKILLRHHDAGYSIPALEDLQHCGLNPQNVLYLGRLESMPCFAGDLSLSCPAAEGYELVGLRQVHGLVEDELFWLAARAFHIINWDRNNQFCGRCGSKMEYKKNEHSKHCPSCDYTAYTKISPAVIVAVTKGDRLLLAQNALNKTGLYSVLAGFVEPGESLEECVAREIKEEAGIDVKNITYFGSQPWPFPDSLMVGFTAEHAGGDLVIDKTELSAADWFTKDDIPPGPGKLSISRSLIDWFINKNSQDTI